MATVIPDSAKCDQPVENLTSRKGSSQSDAKQAAKNNDAAIPDRRPSITVDDSRVSAVYSNFCRVTGTPEELIVDFGLNPQSSGAVNVPVEATQRIVVNFFTAKRMVAALQLALARHEAAFGVLETDVQKRLTTSFRQQSGT